MDGLKTLKDSNVIVIGATNRPFDLDDAVLRRLPRRLLVDLPGEKEREGLWLVKFLIILSTRLCYYRDTQNLVETRGARC